MNKESRAWVLSELVSLLEDTYDPDTRNRLLQIIYRLKDEGDTDEQSES